MKKILLLLLAAVLVASVANAQTALSTTTLSAAVDNSTRTVSVASATGIDVGDLIFVDREAMEVRGVSGTALTVNRGYRGFTAPHATAALVYFGAKDNFYQSVPLGGACTRTSELFLPRIVLNEGDVWDCPVGAQVWTLLNSPTTQTARSVWFNLDNGAGTTIDDVILRESRPIVVTACRILYVDATAGTVAGGTAAVGTTVGGVDIVAATNYENAKAVGTTTAMVIASGFVAANTPVIVRHTGVAVTQAGQSVVECTWHYR